ncbi:hypothetical protein ALNOE001_22020 [Candidatus Methanobinarius endosymbioticus]|uniref:Uncharacterized protein n=1 Tax=Candidatus Methanobinarius endosymbioticus TaxID=2006182 RepID=A0A366MA14_9EURY|nr:hypothetical protein ALNOE001_22020 [Candidatus Methanobinarius endosymbioticus]
MGLFYQTVLENNTDKTNQIDSRSFISSPALNNKAEKIKFSHIINKRPYLEYDKFNNTVKDLKQFKNYFNDAIKKFDIENGDYVIINPFLEYTFLKLTELSMTETRQLDIIGNIFDSYCYLCNKRCFKIKTKNCIYLIPKIKDVQKFINLIYSNVGLKTYERSLLLFLNNKIDSLPVIESVTETIKTAEDFYNEIEEKEYENDQYNNPSILNKETMKKLFIKYGILENKDKDQLKLTIKKDKYFFTVSNIRRRFNGNKKINYIDNLNNYLINLSVRGFWGQFENKKGRGGVLLSQ